MVHSTYHSMAFIISTTCLFIIPWIINVFHPMTTQPGLAHSVTRPCFVSLYESFLPLSLDDWSALQSSSVCSRLSLSMGTGSATVSLIRVPSSFRCLWWREGMATCILPSCNFQRVQCIAVLNCLGPTQSQLSPYPSPSPKFLHLKCRVNWTLPLQMWWPRWALPIAA